MGDHQAPDPNRFHSPLWGVTQQRMLRPSAMSRGSIFAPSRRTKFRFAYSYDTPTVSAKFRRDRQFAHVRQNSIQAGGLRGGPASVALNVSQSNQIVTACIGRSERIRTSDPIVPNDVRYQAALHSDMAGPYKAGELAL
jgi:hypothetical protein